MKGLAHANPIIKYIHISVFKNNIKRRMAEHQNNRIAEQQRVGIIVYDPFQSSFLCDNIDVEVLFYVIIVILFPCF